MNNLLEESAKDTVFRRLYSPDFSYPKNWIRRADGWASYLHTDPKHTPSRHPTDVLDIQINDNGSAWLFCGRAAHFNQGKLYMLEDLIAGLTTRLLFLIADLYDRASYVGQVDIGLAITGAKGATTVKTRNSIFDDDMPLFDKEDYRRSARVLAVSLKDDPRIVAQKLVMPLVRATTQGTHDPFKS